MIIDESKILLAKNFFIMFKREPYDYKLKVYDNDYDVKILEFIISRLFSVDNLYDNIYDNSLLAKAYLLRSKLYLADKIELVNHEEIYDSLKSLSDTFSDVTLLIKDVEDFFIFEDMNDNILYKQKLKKYLASYYYIKNQSQTEYIILGLKA